MKKLPFIFLLAFAANFLWEYAHSVLYVSYKGAPITEWILVRATFWDALIITALALIFIKIEYFRVRLWWVLIFGIVLGVGIERWALATGRWAYAPAMPIDPFFHVGISPAVQLGIIAYAVLIVVLKRVGARAR
jgi:hypothetical protein